MKGAWPRTMEEEMVEKSGCKRSFRGQDRKDLMIDKKCGLREERDIKDDFPASAGCPARGSDLHKNKSRIGTCLQKRESSIVDILRMRGLSLLRGGGGV